MILISFWYYKLMKTVIISPGWNQSSEDERYDFVVAAYRDKGYKVVRYSPRWNNGTMATWVDGLTDLIDEADGEMTLWGFSLGAMASLVASAKRPVVSLVLCSPSGYFKEYLSLIDARYLSQWNTHQLDAFKALSFHDYIQSVRSKDNYVFAGELELKEWPAFNKIVDDLKAINQFKVRVLEETHHDFSAPHYKQAISEAINVLQ